jgi:hypothetical protein
MNHRRFDNRGHEDEEGINITFYTDNVELTEEDHNYMKEQIKNIFKDMPIFNLAISVETPVDNEDGYIYTTWDIKEASEVLGLERTIYELTLQYLDENFEYPRSNTKSARNVAE